MKYRHYAPSKPLKILDGTDDQVYRFLYEKERTAVICFDHDLPYINNDKVISCGPAGDSLTQARRLFSVLREIDKCENIDTIYARMPSKVGIGLAVFNRLVKAAGFEIIMLS